MRKLIILIFLLPLLAAGQVLIHPYDMQIAGDLQVDTVLRLPNLSNQNSDSILVMDNDTVYYQLVTIKNDTLFWGADTIVSGSTISITDNQIAVGTGTGIEGDAHFTWNGSTFVIVGEATITPNSATTGLLIDQNNNYHGLSVDCESTNYYGICVQSPQPMALYQDAANGRGLWVYRNNDAAEASELVSFYNDHASDTKPTLQLGNDGSGPHISTRATNENLIINPDGTGVISVLGTTNYEDNVTFDDAIPNKKYVDDVVIEQDSTWIQIFVDTLGGIGNCVTKAYIDTIVGCSPVYVNGGLATTTVVTTNLGTAGSHTENAYIDTIPLGTVFSQDIEVDGAWQDWTPTLAWTGTAPTVNGTVARYMRINNTVFYDVLIQFEVGGTCPTALDFTLPTTPKDIGNPLLVVGFLSRTGSEYTKGVYPYIDANTPVNKVYCPTFAIVATKTYYWSFSGHFEIE